ncbi:MAG: hypothetical protein SFZ02_12335 [bacterium]|nr:hypothetical protein [bacterium]
MANLPVEKVLSDATSRIFENKPLVEGESTTPFGIGGFLGIKHLYYIPIKDGIPQWDEANVIARDSDKWDNTRVLSYYTDIDSCDTDLGTLYYTWAYYRGYVGVFSIDRDDGEENFDQLRQLLCSIQNRTLPNTKFILAMLADLFRAENQCGWDDEVIDDEEYGIPTLIDIFNDMSPATKELPEWATALHNIRETINAREGGWDE